MATSNGFFSWLPENTSVQRLVRVLVIVAVFSSPVWGYLLYANYQQRQECASEVSYRPATESTNTGSAWAKQGEAAHYTWGGSKFETKQDAIRYCTGKQD